MSGTTSTSSSSSQFQIKNGQIIAPDGTVYTARGINVYDSQMGDASQILADFPGINFIRLNVYSYQSPSAYASFIQTMTNAGVVVELEDHTNSTGTDAGGGQGNAFTGQQLTDELNWYSAVASAYASNPYVWFGTNNEPPTAGLSTWEQETYNAIRNTGNNNPILMELPGGGPNANGLTPSTYSSMTNIVWDAHYYGWVSNFSTNQATVTAGLNSEVAAAQAITSANGTVPVIIGEYGPSTDGQNTDANGSQVLQAVQQDAQSGVTSGAVAWGFASGANDNLTAGGSLTSYGQEVAQWIASTASSSPTPTPTPTPTSTPTATPSANDTVVLAGSTVAITDAGGHKWTITSGGQVAINGTADTTTANVTELAYVNGTIWQENSSHLWWGETAPNASWSPAAGTSVSPLPATPSPTPAPTPAPTPTPTPAPTPTPTSTSIILTPTSGGSITDGSGDVWTLSSAGETIENGTPIGSGSGTSELTAVQGVIWGQAAATKAWYTYVNGYWIAQGSATPPASTPSPTPTPTPTPSPTSAPAASPNDTMVLAGSTNTIVDASHNTWSITSTGQVAVNGVADATTANVTELAYVNKTVWQENASYLWWGKTTPGAAWSPATGTSVSPLPAPITIASGTASETVSQSRISVVATAGSHMLFISGAGDIVSLAGGADTITDTGSGNTYILPAAGNGTDTFTSNILNNKGDTLDFKTALAATSWNGTSATLPNYLTVTNTSGKAVISIAATSGGTGTTIATLSSSTSLSLSTLLAHSII